MSISNDPMREQIYLAALLHDIGKFYQRADTGAVNSSKHLKEETKKLESIICPHYKGFSSHKHVLWTAQFINDYYQVFNKLLDKSGLKGLSPKQMLIQLASAHHLASEQLSTEGAIIREADHLSSGMDRTTDIAFRDEQEEGNWDSFKTKRMVSIFEGILKEEQSHKYHLPVEAINFKSSFFPEEVFSTHPDYKKLWEEFNAEFKFLQQENYRDFSETLYYLLYKYTCTIPSSTINFPDVSLFDHLKTTAAIAVCLYDSQKGEIPDKSNPFLMIGADMSGIQNYIYNILSKSAAKNLKGRSFYLKLLSDSVVKILLDGLNLFEANVIYNAGGGFFILAPNTEFVNTKLKELKTFIEEKLFETHGTSLYFAIDSISLSKEILMGKDNTSDLGKCWDDLFKKRDENKRQRYKNKIVNDYEYFFTPGETGGITPRDVITGEEIPTTDKYCYTLEGVRKKNIQNQSDEIIRELTYKQILLGRKLKSADIWVISKQALNYWSDKDSINPGNLGIYYYFLTRNEIKEKNEQLKGSADSVKIITINGNDTDDCDFLNTMIQGSNNVYGFDFYGGNDFPADNNDDPRLFDQLAGEEGFKRIGVLRMDVDNLGKIFKEGIKSEQSSFSRYSALSRNLDWFFKGYLNTLWDNNFKDDTYIIYSGGDDLFLVGQWNSCISFAEKIREEFKVFTCKNENFNISGGLSIVTPKYPIKKASEESGDAENKAKNYPGKNAVCILGFPLCWDKEYPIVKSVKDKLLELLKSDKLPKSFISKLNSHYSMTSIESETGEFKLPPRLYWMMAYDFERMKTRKEDKETKDLIDQCKKDIISNTINNKGFEVYHSFQLWYLAARWAELEYRSSNNSKIE